MTLQTMIKLRCGIPEQVTVYDEAEIKPLIMDAIDDMKSAGVPEWILPAAVTDDTDTINPRVITCIALYVMSTRGVDRTGTNTYMRMYRNKLHKLMLEEEEDNANVDNIDITP